MRFWYCSVKNVGFHQFLFSLDSLTDSMLSLRKGDCTTDIFLFLISIIIFVFFFHNDFNVSLLCIIYSFYYYYETISLLNACASLFSSSDARTLHWQIQNLFTFLFTQEEQSNDKKEKEKKEKVNKKRRPKKRNI